MGARASSRERGRWANGGCPGEGVKHALDGSRYGCRADGRPPPASCVNACHEHAAPATLVPRRTEMDRDWHKSPADHVVRAELQAAGTRNARSDAELLGRIAEYDARQLSLVDTCSSMVRYRVEALGTSEGTALKRIRVARIARRFPPRSPVSA